MSKLRRIYFCLVSGILLPIGAHASVIRGNEMSQSLWWSAISSFFSVNLVFFILYLVQRTPLMRVLALASGFIVLAFQGYFSESLEAVINHFEPRFSFQGWELIAFADLQILIALLVKPKTKFRA